MRQKAREAGTPIGQRCARRAVLAGWCCACLWPLGVQAQVSGSVGVVSDYRYRGVTLSDGDPAVQASVGYDAASGAYFGLFGSSTRIAGDAGSQCIPYAGYARRDQQGRSWDVGVRHVGFSGEGDYAEAHVGVAFRRVALRLHFAPDYYGATDNAYLEADFALPVGERVRFLLHGGVSRSGSGSGPTVVYESGGGGGYDGDGPGVVRYETRYEDTDRTRFDGSAGFVFQTGFCDVQATVHVREGTGAGYEGPAAPDDRTGFVLGCIKRW